MAPYRSRYSSVDLNSHLCPSRLMWHGERRGPEPEPPDDLDVFAKQAAGVCALYTELLPQAEPVPAHSGWIRVHLLDPGEDVPSPSPVAPREGGDHLHAAPDLSLLALPAASRPAAYLRWLQPLLLDLAAVRGVDATGFEQTFDACLAAGCLPRWEGPGRSSPDRRWRAVPSYAVDAEGDGWLVLTVRDRAGDVVAEGGPWDVAWPKRVWRASARSLRWTSPTTVGIGTWDPFLAASWGLPAAESLELTA